MRTLNFMAVLLLAVFALPTFAEEGKSLNDMKVVNEEGKEITLGSLQGKKGLIVFQYPKADTPGCTKESCGFSNDFEKYKEAGYGIAGLSHDTAADQKAFKDKYKMVITLLSDPKGELATALGIEPRKRQTAILDASGKVTKVIKEVKAAEHPTTLLGDLTK